MRNTKPYLSKSRLSICVAMIALGSQTAISAEIEEIIVTAQKREQNMQDIGIAVSAFNADQIRDLGIKSADEIGSSISGVQVYNFRGKGAPSFVVRGIGTQDFAPNSSPTAAVYLDEVYLGSNVISGFQVFDVDRVEVLKGPQGTLFGRNTTGGAVSYTTKRPTSETEAYLDLGIENYDTVSADFAAGGGLTQEINYRLAGRYSDQSEGYYTNNWSEDMNPFPNSPRYFNPQSNIGKDKNWALRMLLDYEISDTVQALLNIHGGSRDADTLPVTPIGFTQIPGAAGTCQATATGGAVSDPRFCGDSFGYSDTDGDVYTVSNDFVGSTEEDNIGTSLNIVAELDAFTLTSITAFEQVGKTSFADNDGAPWLELNQIRDIDYDQISQEVRLSRVADSLMWMIGLYGSKDNVDQVFCGDLNPLIGLGTECRLDFEQTTDTYAIYGHSEYSFSDKWKLTAGLRYTQEKRDFYSKSTITIPGVGEIIVNFGTTPEDQALIDESKSWSNVSGKLAMDYQLSDDVLMYLSYSRGFKSGGFDGDFAFIRKQLEPYDQEIVSSYEFGWKTMLAQNSLRFNGAVFYYDYQDPQVRVQQVSDANLPYNQLINLKNGKVKGLEMELLWKPTDQLDIMASMALIDTKLESPDQPIYDGNQLPMAAKESATLLVKYEWPLADAFSMSIQLDGKYNGNYDLTASNLPYLEQDSYFLTNARITLFKNNGDYEIALWGKNLSDETFAVQSYSLFGAYPVAYNSPRTYGVNFRYNW